MTREQERLRDAIERDGMGIVDALNALQEAGMISDLVVELEDVADGDVDVERAVEFMEKRGCGRR